MTSLPKSAEKTPEQITGESHAGRKAIFASDIFQSLLGVVCKLQECTLFIYKKWRMLCYGSLPEQVRRDHMIAAIH